MSTTTGSGITRYRKRRRSAQGEREEEGHASFGLVLGPYTAAVGVNDSTTDCQAETSALRAVGRATVKFVENARFIARSETGTTVSNFHRYRLFRRRRQNPDRPVLSGVFRGVVEQVDDDL